MAEWRFRLLSCPDSASAEAVEAEAEQVEQHAAKGAAAAAEQLQRGAACSSRQRATYTIAPRKLKELS